MDSYVIGIDGGGTKTRIVAIHTNNFDPPAPNKSADVGPCNIASMPASDALSTIAAGVAQIGIDSKQICAVCAGIAGYSFENRHQDFLAGLQLLFPAGEVKVVPDFVAAHHGAFNGAEGIIAIAGTGSVAYGRNLSGNESRAGGYGYLVDDAGSGYGVGRCALAAVLAAADGSGEKTMLTDFLTRELSSVDSAYLIAGIYGGKLNRVAIAALSKLVAEAALSGDAVANVILGDTAKGQAKVVTAVAHRLFADSMDIPIAMCGGLWNVGTALVNPFKNELRSQVTGARVEHAQFDAATGAALHAHNDLLTKK